MLSSAIISPVFFLLDVREGDHITHMRHEVKFEYINADIRKLVAICEVNNKCLAYAGKESIVNSIYFDDHNLNFLRENLAGIGMRTKLRLRWYDSDLPEKKFYFEVKRRINDIITKDRFPITSSLPFRELEYKVIINELLRLLPETPRELLMAHHQPVILIRYRRRHFVSRDPQSPVRITLDHDIAGFDQIGANRPSVFFKSPLHDRIVIEAKSPVGPEGFEERIPHMLYPLCPRRSRFSKYVLCCFRLGYATGISETFYG